MIAKFLTPFLLLSALICCPDEKYCLSCSSFDDKKFCSMCSDAYFDVQANVCSTTNLLAVDNCILYIKLDDQIACFGCKMGYFKNEKGACVACPVDECAVCDNGKTCEACFNSRKLNKDLNTCEAEKQCSLENCSVCATDSHNEEVCYMCANGYAENPHTNKQCVESTDNCMIADPEDLSKCGWCRPGFFITGKGKCVANEEGASFLFYFIIIAVLAGVGVFVYNRFLKKNEDDIYRNAME
jgi:hypothetical protein